MNITFEQVPTALMEIIERLDSIEKRQMSGKESKPKPKKNPFDDYIEKSEIAGKYASASTLWHWEKKGKLKLYAIGGKRYYKRKDIENLFTEIKK